MEGNPVNVNPFAYEDLKCSECGHNVFQPGLIFKMVPGLLLGAGDQKEVAVPVKVACCAKCGALSPMDQKDYDEQTEAAKKAAGQKEGSSTLII